SNPTFSVDSASTATLLFDVTSVAYSGFPATDETQMPVATFALGTPSVDAGTISWTTGPGTLTSEALVMFGGMYDTNPYADALTVTLPYSVQAPDPVATTTALAASPESTALAGDEVTLSATVDPAAAGTVEFFDGSTSLGTDDVADGAASLATSALESGAHSLTAAFTPADATAFAASTSGPVAYTITAAPDSDSDATSTTLSAAPETRALLGDDVTLTATVANESGSAAPQGSVEFFTIAAGDTERVSLGSEDAADGEAALTTSELAAGGHAFTAVFTPTDDSFAPSAADVTENFGIVDPTTVDIAAPEDGTAISDVSATWAWSEYADGWTKAASGDVTVADGSFVLTGGTGIVSDEATVVQFTGALRVEAYAGFFPPNGQWIELVDPVLTISAEGADTWSGDVRTGVGAYDSSASTTHLVVATASGIDVPDFTADVDASVAFDYEGTTAQGTWHADYANAWPNAFVLAVPSAIQAFYYQSSESAANATKPPAPLSLSWTAPAEEEPEPGVVSGATLEWGLKESFRNYISGPIAHGEISLDGTARSDSGEFIWSNGSGTYDVASNAGEVSYSGSVHFTGHAGALDMTISNPRVAVTGLMSATLYVDVVAAGYNGTEDVNETGVAFATLTLPAGVEASDGESITWSGATAVLTEDGARGFAGFYSAGTALDPVTFTFPLVEDAPVTPVLALDGSSTVTQGGLLSVSGSGFEPGERLTAVVHSDPIELGAFTASDAGTVNVRWTIPADFTTGDHSLVITRPDGTTATAYFTVAPAATGGSGSDGGARGGDAAASESPAADVCTAQAVSNASLSWGVKESFRSYIEGPIAQGTIAGAWGSGSGAYSTGNDSGSVRYGGSIHYTGHGGLLDITLSNPRIQVTGASIATLFLDVRSAGYGSHESVNASGVAFASLSLGAATESSSQIAWSGASASLTSAGAAAFMGFYEAGEALDAVSFTFPLGGEVPCDSTTNGSLAATGGPAPLDAVWAAGLLLLLGAGAFAWRRRQAA
ncbi:HtaA domain-containing protein, partial [Microbacterium sp.]|uniref:HtaA domain-containing protein n=1 Tax=Microbacterium sp. TaxID=51671 RepID=UPI0026367393